MYPNPKDKNQQKGSQLPRKECLFPLVVTLVTKVIIIFERPLAINPFS